MDGRVKRFTATSECRHFSLGMAEENRYDDILPEQPSNNILGLPAHIFVLQNLMDKHPKLSTDSP